MTRHIRSLLKGIGLLILMTILISCQYHPAGNQNCDETAHDFDITKFTGIWYEIARIPHSDEKNLEIVSMTISLNMKDEGYSVIHRSWNTRKRDWQEKTGRLWLPDSMQHGCLRISYVLFFGGDFKIMDFDREDYQWALVKSDDIGTAWILARQPSLPFDLIQSIAAGGKDRGIPTQKLKMVYQNLARLKKKLDK